MTMSRFLTVCMLLLVFTTAQSQATRMPSLSAGFQVTQPLGEFKEQYNGTPLGFGAQLSIPIRLSPIEWGFGYAWNKMGGDNRDVTAFLFTDSLGNKQYGDATMRIRSLMQRYNGHLRFRFTNLAVQPFVDGCIGLETFRTETDITIQESGFSTAQNPNTESFDMTVYWSWAAGVRVRLAPHVFVEGRFEQQQGGKAEYVDSETIEVNQDNTLRYDTKQSTTNKYVYQLGLAVTF